MRKTLTITLVLLCVAFLGYGQSKYGPKRSESGKYIVDHESHVMPGGGYNFYFPSASDSLGTFSGFSPEFLIYNYIRQDESRGPSHLRFYGSISILQSNKEGVANMLKYGLGLNLSVERNPHRNFLIPYFGLEFGGLNQESFNTLQFTPMGGLFLYYDHRLVVSTSGGYVYPLKEFEKLSGAFFNATINFTLW